MKQKPTHVDARALARMVDVAGKSLTEREAVAEAELMMSRETFRLLTGGRTRKGDPFAVARVAGIQAAKRTPELIPLCHPLQLTSVAIDFEASERRSTVRIMARARAVDRAGVEMEALTAVTIAALTLYDMCKAVERGIVIGPIWLLEKRGGETGTWRAKRRRKGGTRSPRGARPARRKTGTA
jgi:cyclic pyranopterin phosphate synthase